MRRRIVGKFWNYDGNSINGKDHERKTPKGYDFHTLKIVAAIANDCEGHANNGFSRHVTRAEAKEIEIIHHKGDSFGHEVAVKAPKSVWEKASKL